MHPSRKGGGVRWGHLREMAGITRVGDKTYRGSPNRIQKLSSWRRMHELAGGHGPVRAFARKVGVKHLSSDITKAEMNEFIKRREFSLKN